MVERVVDVQIRRANSDEQLDALELLFCSLEPPLRDGWIQQMLHAAEGASGAVPDVAVAWRGSAMQGAIGVQLLPGRLAILWPPRVAPGAAEAITTALLNWSIDEARRRGAELMQALVPPPGEVDEQRLERAGFQFAAEVLYLAKDVQADRGELSKWSCPLELRRYAGQRQRMEQIVQRTYQQTLDCPLLDNLRTIDDVLQGYEQTGDSAAEHWFFVQHQGRDVGCLLLADHQQRDQCELVYMGLVPEVRGRRWGRWLVRFAEDEARRMQRRHLILAVDAANAPARAVYDAAGFVPLHVQRLWIKSLRGQ